MERAWQTDVTRGFDSSAEERWSLRERPVITQTVQLTGMDQNSSADLLTTFARYGQHAQPAPIYSDRTKLTQEYSSGNRLFCDTTYRRFFLGQRIAVASRSWGVQNVGGAYALAEYATIKAITDTYIDIDNPLLSVDPYSIGSLVYPLFDSEPVLNISYDRVTRGIIDGAVTWIERSAQSTLPSLLSSPHVALPVFALHEGLPIFDAKMNGQISGAVTRSGTRFQSGRGSVIDIQGELSHFNITADLRFIDRVSWWRLTSFFDTVRGRTYPFWFVNPQRLWELLSVQSTTVFRVARTHYWQVFDPTASVSSDGKPSWLNHFALVENDGTVNISTIVSVAEISKDVWDITVADPLPTSNVRRITAAHKARFDSDVLSDEWITFDVVTTQMSMMQLHDEMEVVITNL
jgi:hypothetical protein